MLKQILIYNQLLEEDYEISELIITNLGNNRYFHDVNNDYCDLFFSLKYISDGEKINNIILEKFNINMRNLKNQIIIKIQINDITKISNKIDSLCIRSCGLSLTRFLHILNNLPTCLKKLDLYNSDYYEKKYQTINLINLPNGLIELKLFKIKINFDILPVSLKILEICFIVEPYTPDEYKNLPTSITQFNKYQISNPQYRY